MRSIKEGKPTLLDRAGFVFAQFYEPNLSYEIIRRSCICFFDKYFQVAFTD
jgi:hypothetical protein